MIFLGVPVGMNILACPRCGHVFSKPSDLWRHTNRKFLCAPNVADVDLREFQRRLQEEKASCNRFKCEWCGASSVNQQALDRHRSTCPKRDTLEFANNVLRFVNPGATLLEATDVSRMSTTDVLRFLSETVTRVEGRVPVSTTVTGNHNTVQNNTTNHHTINNTTNNHVVVNVTVDFGTEEVSLSLSELEALLRVHPVNAVKDLVEKTHFRTERGKNWFISNLKDCRAKIFRGDKWLSKDGKEVVYEVFDKHRNVIDETCDMARNEEGELPNNCLGQRVKRWERESNKDDFEERCQESVKKLGYENNPKFSSVP